MKFVFRNFDKMTPARILIAVILCSVFASNISNGQSMHFSQFYNAPLLLNPANTGLMPEYDYRIGANYRNQWAVLPVPYTTESVYGDLKIGGNRGDSHPNWLGIGGAIFNDKAGSGSLTLLQLQGNIAYHLRISEHSMLSFGGSGAYVQRTVNYDALSFDAQWDGFTFNSNLPNGEKVGILKTNYTTVAAGFNLAFFPNEAVYVKLGGSVSNINQPIETFYNTSNQVALRPIGNLDILVRTGPDLILNPSVYYTEQGGAAEIVVGSLTRTRLGTGRDAKSSELLLGLFYRVNDALIGAAGYQFGGLQFMASYDLTMSSLAPYNGGYGAMEFSITYGGTYYKNRGNKMYSCPRF